MLIKTIWKLHSGPIENDEIISYQGFWVQNFLVTSISHVSNFLCLITISGLVEPRTLCEIFWNEEWV
jgi:hypothetical protein